MRFKNSYNCGFELTIELIGGKWKGLILWHLYEKKIMRNGEMMRAVKGITQKMLTQQLREMEESNLVIRKVYNQVPPKVEYSLTKRAKKLEDVLTAMKDWGFEYAKENDVNVLCKL